jgi:hypothetical protein
MKNTRFMLATEKTILDLIAGTSPAEYKTLDAAMLKNQKYIKKILSSMPNLSSFLIRKEYICIIYIKPAEEGKNSEIKICTLYDKDLNFIKKGTIDNIAKYLGLIRNVDYIDVSNITSKPKLFMQICIASGKILPQAIADGLLQDCKNGVKYAQFLVKPKNPIELICETEGITRSELAKSVGLKVATIENALSRGKCSKNVLSVLKEVYKYV